MTPLFHTLSGQNNTLPIYEKGDILKIGDLKAMVVKKVSDNDLYAVTKEKEVIHITNQGKERVR